MTGTPLHLGSARRRQHPSTLAITAGRPPRVADGPLSDPPVLASTYHAGGPVAYGRDGNPTWEAFESALGALEGGATVAFASGMAAITAVIELLPIGAVVVAPQQAYSNVTAFLDERATAGRLVVRRVDITDTEAVVGALDGAACVWTEAVTNPLLDVAEIEAIARAARQRGALSVCDNTFLTPICFRPLEVGIDIALHSVTKFLAGHSDVVMGSASTADGDLCARLRRQRSRYGAIPGPMETWLALRGMRTLALRMERAQHNALVLAERLSAHAAVSAVRYPGLPGDRWHERAAASFDGFGAMVSFEVHGGAEAAEALCGATELIVHATSLGGVESTIERRRRWPNESSSTPASLVRLSTGCEHVEDLWADLCHGLDVAASVASTVAGLGVGQQ